MVAPHEIIERALAASRADGCIVIVDRASTANVRWASNTTTTNGAGESTSVTIVAVRDGALGIATTSDALEDPTDLVRAAEAAAEGKPPAFDAMPLVGGEGVPADWGESSPTLDRSALESAADAVGALFESARAADALTYGYAESTDTTTWMATSAGCARRSSIRSSSVEFTAKSSDLERSTWNAGAGRDFTDIDVGALWDAAARKLRWADAVHDMPAGRYEVILEPSAAADMTLALYGGLDARAAVEGRSPFSAPAGSTRVGEQLFARGVTLRSDPALPGMESTPFVVARGAGGARSVFDNGLDLSPTTWVEDGVLRTLVTSRHQAGATATDPAPAIGNLAFVGGTDAGTDELIAATGGRALLITCLWYIRTVDPQSMLLTGLTRDGVYLVDGGEVIGAVNNFRFNMSPITVLANATQIGRPVRAVAREYEFSRIVMPPLRVADWHMSSPSQAR